MSQNSAVKPDYRRIKFFVIDEAMLLLFRQGAQLAYEVVEGLPGDAQILRRGWDNARKKYTLAVYSASFDIAEVGEVPFGQIVIRQIPTSQEETPESSVRMGWAS